MVVGAWALGAHGLPRATGDLDIFIEKSDDNSKNMVKALREFGVPSGEMDDTTFTKDVIFRMGVPPMRLEILTTISGLTFPEAYKNREYLRFDKLDVPCISLQDLLKNKKAAARPKDLLDIEIILKKYPHLKD